MNGNVSAQSGVVGVSPLMVQQPSALRRAAVWSGVTGGRITLSPSANVADGAGIVINQGDPPLTLTRDLHH